MKLWLLRPMPSLLPVRHQNPWEPWYDKTFGFVVRARNEKEARGIAQSLGGYETSDGPNSGPAWLDPQFSSCEVLSTRGPAEMIIEDHRSA